MKSRLAPTPSGFLHRGNAFNFLLTAQMVRASKGQLLLRIDDIDKGRYRPEYVAHIFKTLDALGIEIGEGPDTVDALETIWSQHLRLDKYAKTLQDLRSTGKVYACDCSRKKVNAEAINGNYSGYCRHRNLPLEQEGVTWRIDVRGATSVQLPDFPGITTAPINLEEAMGDFVIRKKDGLPAYQVCSLTDDLLFGIDLIVRGEDLLDSSAAQIWLADLLGTTAWLEQLKLLHHPLLKSRAGEKLSKSAGAAALLQDDKAAVDFARQELIGEIQYWAKDAGSQQLVALLASV